MKPQLDEIKEALRKATSGPWNALPDAVRHGYGPGGWICQMYDVVNESVVEFDNQEANAYLIANSREWLASLVSQVEELERKCETAIKANVLFYQGSSDLISKNHQLHAQVEAMQQELERTTKERDEAFELAANHFRALEQVKKARQIIAEDHADLVEERDFLRSELAAKDKVLEWYADNENYKVNHPVTDYRKYISPVEHDNGERARQTLQQVKGDNA